MTCTCGASRGEALSHDYDCENATPSPMTTPNDATGGHTLLPWKWQEFGGRWYLTAQDRHRHVVLSASRHGPLHVLDSNKRLVPLTPDHADAQYIETAVNNHAKLVEALESLTDFKDGRCVSCGCEIAKEGYCGCSVTDSPEYERRCRARALLQSIEKGSAR